MTQLKFSTPSRKGKHLDYAERCQMEILKKEGYSNRHIARAIGRNHQTINNEIHKGTVKQLKQRQKYHGKVYDYYHTVYLADAGQAYYDTQQLNRGRQPKWVAAQSFIEWADHKLLTDHWAPDVVVQYARKHHLFENSMIPCTTTLYQWIDSGIMRTKNIDLLEKLSRSTKDKGSTPRKNKRILGPSIDQRPSSINDRSQFGHWEIDTVIGQKKSTEPVLLTLVERQTRFELVMKLAGKDSASVTQAVAQLKQRAGDEFPRLFKSITTDNGSEFADLYELLQETLQVYFAHPYASWERGSSENQHKFIRCFLPKGMSLRDMSETQCLRIQQWMNDYPRRILDYETPHERFVRAFHQERQFA